MNSHPTQKGTTFDIIFRLATQLDLMMITNPDTTVQELQALLRQKQDELAVASDAERPQEELTKLYRDIKEVQYQLVLLRNKILDPSQADNRSAVL